MSKITLTVCCGTYCHVMGGAGLQSIDELLPEEMREQVDFRFTTCMDHCRKEGANPPFAEVDGKLIAEATVVKIMAELKRVMDKKSDDSNK